MAATQFVKNVNNTNYNDVHKKHHLHWYHRKIDEQHQAAHQFLPLQQNIPECRLQMEPLNEPHPRQ
jgi:hypothetical protein